MAAFERTFNAEGDHGDNAADIYKGSFQCYRDYMRTHGQYDVMADSLKDLGKLDLLAASAGSGGAAASLRAWYLRGAEADAAWLNMSVMDKIYYEIGQKITSNYAAYANMSAVARGQVTVADIGWVRALLPEGGGLTLGASTLIPGGGTLLSTGPTPLFRWLLPKLFIGGAGAGVGGSSDKKN